MNRRIPNYLLALASLLSIAGATVHALAFRKVLAATAASNLPRFYAASLKGLWLADSATLLIVGGLLGMVAVSPRLTTRTLLVLTALVPGATSVMLYVFLGNFPAAHLLALIAVLAFLGGWQIPVTVGEFMSHS